MASYQLLASDPLAPSFDTVVILGQNADVLANVALVLVGPAPVSSNKPATIHLVREAFDLADGDIQQSFITREPWRIHSCYEWRRMLVGKSSAVE
jgi:hypothetical protein